MSIRSKSSMNVVGRSIYLPAHDPIVIRENDEHNSSSKQGKSDLFADEETYVPTRNKRWYLNDYHSLDHNDIYKSLKTVDEIGRKINSLPTDDFVDYNSHNNSDIDELARRYFPVTLGTSFKSTEDVDNHGLRSSLTFSPPGNGLPENPQPWRLETPHNKAQMKHARLWKPIGEYLSDNIEYLDREDKVRDEIRTPYQAELSSLRLHRLRIEEDILMEKKRQEELHRLRGPQPKWYELRDSRFHYEAHKNNQLLRKSDYWQQLIDYRCELERKSTEFNRKYTPQQQIDQQRHSSSQSLNKYCPTKYVSIY